MKAALRWIVIGMVGGMAAPFGAYAVTPMSNGVGDGEANVPFASQTSVGTGEGGARAGADRARYGGDHRKVAGRSGRAADRRATPADAADPAAPGDGAVPQGGGDGSVEQLIWTAP